MRFWVTVASKDHALRGINGGFIQACHGKAAPLKRMKRGDYVIFYCPKLAMESTIKYQKFLGVGKVICDKVYQFQMSDSFIPYRMDIDFVLPACEVAILPLIPQLEFIQDKVHWGYPFKFGHFQVSVSDFELIVKHMSKLDSDSIRAEYESSQLL